MKTTTIYSSLFLSLTVAISGCDVSDGFSGESGGSSSGQGGDSVIQDFPIAYIQRPVPIGLEDDNALRETVLSENLLEPETTFYGAKLVVKDRAAVAAEARVITDRVYPPITPDPTPEDPNPEPVDQLYDVRDISPNYDGTRIVFSMRAPEDPSLPDEEQEPWHIWEYDFVTDEVTQITSGSVLTGGHDRFPAYLPDDSIVFASTRQRESKAMLGNQGRPQYTYVTEADDEIRAFTLHVIDAEREEIKQISFGKGHDIYPTVLDDGRILFLRGDDTSNRNRDRLSLYTMNPDGTNVSPYYGFHSPSATDTDGQGALSKPMQMQDGRIIVTYRERETSQMGGDIYTIDAENYIDNTTPTYDNLNATGPAEVSVSVGEVVLNGQSPHGFFNSAFPLYDGTNRLLVSWMPCTVQGYQFDIYVEREFIDVLDADNNVVGEEPIYRLIDINQNYVTRNGNPINTEAGEQPVEITVDEVRALPCSAATFARDFIIPSEPQFGVWVYDIENATQVPVVFANVPGTIYTEAIALVPRSNPDLYLGLDGTSELVAELIDDNTGVINIRSVYDIDGADVSASGIATMADPLQTPPDTLPVRFVRFVQEANMPHEDEYEIDDDLVEGRGNQNGKSIIGYAQVFPDGSVMTKVPANVPFSMELVDANGRRVGGTLGGRHMNWINVRPGEVRECNGCHTANSTAPHGRADAEAPSVYSGNLSGTNFPNTDLTDTLTLPDVGETMAEYYVRAKRELPAVGNMKFDPLLQSIDLKYTDEFTDPTSGATPGNDINIAYGIPEALGPDNLLTLAPVPFGSCLTEWSANCRIVINYEEHVQPMFEVARTLNDVDITCTNCHATTDPDGMLQVPAPNTATLQLDFTLQMSLLDDMIYLKGYDELFAANDPIQVLNDDGTALVQAVTERRDANGNIVYVTEPQLNDMGEILYEVEGGGLCQPLSNTDPAVIFVLDANGNNIMCTQFAYYQDVNGNPTDADGNLLGPDDPVVFIPEFDPLNQLRYLNPNSGASSNARFFNVFEVPGTTTAPDHVGYLTPAELKLFSEWLDGGSQYYNEIFRAVED